MILQKTLASLALLAAPVLAYAEPYTDWRNDYVGNEPGTVLLWKFDNPAPKSNSAGSGYTATVGDNVTVGVAEGKFGTGFYSAERSTAADSYAQVAGSAGILPTNAMSIEFWFKPVADGVATGNLSYFFDKKFTTDSGVYLALSNTSPSQGALVFSVGNGNTSGSLKTGNLSWDADLWYHIAITFENLDGDAYLKIFRDGEVLASTRLLEFGDLANGSSLFRLGNRLGSSYGSVPGTYDNFRISNIAHEYSNIPEPAAALLLIPVLGGLLLKRQR